MGWIILILVVVVVVIFAWKSFKDSKNGDDIHGQPPDAGDLGGA